MEIESVASLIDATVPMTRKALEKWKSSAPGFRSFALFDPKEIVQTRIIAGLLDPCGNHGQGEIFLRLFLKTIGEEGNFPDSLYNTRIRLEHMTKSIESDRRRIDLLITLPTGRLIALESKARGAGDQPDQIPHYLSEIENLEPQNHVMIYLSPGARRPDNIDDISAAKWNEWTAGAKPRVRCYDYDTLIGHWLGDCHKECEECAPKARSLHEFLKEFQKYTSSEVERSPLMAEELIEDVAANILESKDRLVASIAIHNSRDEVRRRLARRFLDALRKHLVASPKKGWNASTPEEKDGYFSLSLRRRDMEGLFPTFQIGPDEFWGKKCTSWHETIGVGLVGGGNKAADSDKERAKRVLVEVKNILPEGKMTDDWAIFQREFDQMEFERIACLLYDCPPVELQRIADRMKRIAGVIEKIR